jgi:hypothetical protein
MDDYEGGAMTVAFVMFKTDPKTNHGYAYAGRATWGSGMTYHVYANAIAATADVKAHFEGVLEPIRIFGTGKDAKEQLPLEINSDAPFINDPLPKVM